MTHAGAVSVATSLPARCRKLIRHDMKLIVNHTPDRPLLAAASLTHTIGGCIKGNAQVAAQMMRVLSSAKLQGPLAAHHGASQWRRATSGLRHSLQNPTLSARVGVPDTPPA